MSSNASIPAGATSGDRVYLFQVITEPEENPVLLSQRDLDMIVDVGASLPVTEEQEAEDLVDFAILETSDGGPFLYHGHEVPEADIALYVQRGMAHLIARLARSLEVSEEIANAENVSAVVEHLSEENSDSDAQGTD